MKRLFAVLLAVAVAVAFSSVAMAKDKGGKGGHDPEARFKKLDTNGDGFLSKEEFLAGPQAQKNPAKAAELFTKWDTNGDGKLSLDEYKAGVASMPHGKKGGAGGDANK